MSEEDLEKLSYKEALRLVIKILDEQGSQIKSLDDRERMIQRTLERLMGKLEGKKEAKQEEGKSRTWWLGVAGFALGVAVVIIDVAWRLWEAWH